MPIFTQPVHEHGDPDRPGPYPHADAKRQRIGRIKRGPGYSIVFRSQDPSGRKLGRYLFLHDAVQQALRPGEERKLEQARVRLRFDDWSTAQLGAPIRWTAPNGVDVIYVRGQRRTEVDRNPAVYHDFSAWDEQVVPLTRNVGSGRRALRAWAAEHLTNKTTARWQARQLVRPGD